MKAREMESAEAAIVRETEEATASLDKEAPKDGYVEKGYLQDDPISPEDTARPHTVNTVLHPHQTPQETESALPRSPNPTNTTAEGKASEQKPNLRPAAGKEFRPPKVFELPAAFDMDVFLKKLRQYANYVPSPTSNVWKSASQPDGYVYYHIDLVDEMIKETADEAGLLNPTFMSDDRQISNARLVTVYRRIRAKGWAHPKIGDNFHSREFRVEDGRTNKVVRIRLIPINAEALRTMPGDLEAERKGISRLQFIQIK
jgi:hypothetical protein